MARGKTDGDNKENEKVNVTDVANIKPENIDELGPVVNSETDDKNEDIGGSGATVDRSPDDNDSQINNGPVPNAIEVQTIVDVHLKDWPEDREGIHSIHTKEGIFNFINGKAQFKHGVALKLREAGYIE